MKFHYFCLILGLAACSQRSEPMSAESSAQIIGGAIADNIDDDVAVGVVRVMMSTALGPIPCSGVMIGPKLVLTAAHCLIELHGTTLVPYQAAWQATPLASPALGVLFLARDGTVVAMDSERYSIPEKYVDYSDAKASDPDGQHLSYDIGLVELREEWDPLTLAGRRVLPPKAAAKVSTKTGSQVVTYGYGFTEAEKINGVVVKRRPGVLRKKTFLIGDRNALEASGAFSTHADMLVISPENGMASGGVCQGDSGGPTFVLQGGQPLVVGISAYVDGNAVGAVCRSRAAVTSVAKYFPWIQKTAKQWGTVLY